MHVTLGLKVRNDVIGQPYTVDVGFTVFHPRGLAYILPYVSHQPNVCHEIKRIARAK
jgi:hypothetical protein